jgi:hypothetical protein
MHMQPAPNYRPSGPTPSVGLQAARQLLCRAPRSTALSQSDEELLVTQTASTSAGGGARLHYCTSLLLWRACQTCVTPFHTIHCRSPPTICTTCVVSFRPPFPPLHFRVFRPRSAVAPPVPCYFLVCYLAYSQPLSCMPDSVLPFLHQSSHKTPRKRFSGQVKKNLQFLCALDARPHPPKA